MKNIKIHRVNGIRAVLITSAMVLCGAVHAADTGESPSGEENFAVNMGEMFSKGQIEGNARAIYFHSQNAYYVPGLNQDTASIGGKLGFRSARYNGFSFGLSGFLQRPLHRSSDPAKVDGYIGPDITAMGEAYVRWENADTRVTVGNQALELPFAATYDWRMAPQLFQGVSARYGLSDDNYITAVRMTRFKSYIDNNFKKLTTYTSNVDPYSPIGRTESNGFYGVGGVKSIDFQSMLFKGQAWYFGYLDYAKLTYAEAQLSAQGEGIKPFVAAQVFRETGDGRKLLGNIDSKVYGAQVGAKRNSVTFSVSYDRIVPKSDSYLNGALVTPYSHNVGSGPLFAQPFLSSTQDLGAGNAYAVDLNGSPAPGWFIGARYSYMDLKSSAAAPSLRQSEYLGYAIYHFSGKWKGLSITDFIAWAKSPVQDARFWQNRLAMEYKW
ncbi:outer membrane porin, OprD family [Diaphorobacter ruginosibacter]|uniref:Outer membrane porin, OprD family n=1 Tax=Diaphorobacter ruginosibacter TaxID=1715720 RepID=A0A7G9RTZ3_9BURK|nr:OprD family outer membrane porin [Diaphorobacter ruginosibacter]QNN59068.1 outer membrane porin, OprD family [Diaphorobacter ruginosibacter]